MTPPVAGALGAGASATAAPLINQLQDGIASSLQSAGLDKDAAKGIASGIASLTAAGVGAAVGGTQGAATAFTVDTNNRQLHREEKSALTKSASDFAKKMRLQGYELTDEKALAILTEQADNRVDETQARRLDTATMDDALKSHAQRYLNGVSNTLGSYDDGRGNQIRYFTNTTSSGDRRYEDYKNSSINAMPNTPPIDYVSIQGGGFGVGGNVSVNVLNQEVFVGGGKSTFSSVPGFSVVGGRMIGGSTDTDKRSREVTDMLRGGSVQGTVCAGGLCAGVNQSIGPIGSNPPRAIEIGVGTPGVGGGVGAAVQVPSVGVKK